MDGCLDRLSLPDGSTYKIEGGNGDQKHQGPVESNYGAFISQARRSQPVEWWRENMNLSHYYGFRAINRAVGNIDIREGWNHFILSESQRGVVAGTLGFGHDVHAGDALEWDDRCEGLSESG